MSDAEQNDERAREGRGASPGPIADGPAALTSKNRTLPEYEFCADQVVAETATKLERFIYHNEPAGAEDAEEFRNALLAVLAEARADFEAEPCHCANCTAAETFDEHPDTRRLNWLANAVLACDYGDNPHGKIGWRVMEFVAPVMYGASINNAIDAAIAQKTCGDGGSAAPNECCTGEGD